MIYFDNAATTFPKPKIVREAMKSFWDMEYGNPGRGFSQISARSINLVDEAREEISKFFNIENPLNIAFTKNCSESLNYAIQGLIKENDHVITTDFEHNSISRVLEYLRINKNVSISYIKTDEYGKIITESIKENIKENTKAIIINHANNLTGAINDIEKVGEIAKENNIEFILDAAQSAGKIKIDFKKDNISVLCAPGHKSLFGPMGTGIICLKEGITLDPIIFGGTGSFSDSIDILDIMPDYLEVGTINLPGINGLLEGIKYINEVTIDKIREKEHSLIEYIYSSIKDIENIRLYIPENLQTAGIISFNIENQDSNKIAFILDTDYNIAIRAGLHCNYLGHKKMDTLNTGIVRISVSYFNTKSQCDTLIKAIREISDKLK